MIKLLVSEIQDTYLRKNFELLQQFFGDQKILNGNFKFFTIPVKGALTNLKYPHGLGFQPTDVIQTSVVGAGLVTWNYGSFDKTNVVLTTTGDCTIRAFIGSYSDGS